MDFSDADKLDVVALLKLMPEKGNGIGWYHLELILSRQMHRISLDGKLMSLLEQLKNIGLIEIKSINASSHPNYIITAEGKKWLEEKVGVDAT
jgi:hypothetical protein